MRYGARAIHFAAVSKNGSAHEATEDGLVERYFAVKRADPNALHGRQCHLSIRRSS